MLAATVFEDLRESNQPIAIDLPNMMAAFLARAKPESPPLFLLEQTSLVALSTSRERYLKE